MVAPMRAPSSTPALLLLATLAVSCAGTTPPSAPASTAITAANQPPLPLPALTPLFDGRTLTGWQGDPGAWSVRDGAIRGESQKGGFLLYTDRDYDHFRLLLKSRLVSEKNHLG